MGALLIVLFLVSLECCSGFSKTFSAVVVEYHPVSNSSLNSTTNLENNVNRFISIIKSAAREYKADIVVFPESALDGFVDKPEGFIIPDPKLKLQLCSTSDKYDPMLIELSCAASTTGTYVVLNLIEQFYNTTDKKTVLYNTDVVFDRKGAIIARYRKIHLFHERAVKPSPDGELVYFDTDFGVRFGLLTCFDIFFKTPGVALAREKNITHFIFPTHWFSQLPFSSAVQEQYYWAYTLDVVLLASQYNQPSTGSTGSGIYLGRKGPLVNNMTSFEGTFLLHANVPVQNSLRVSTSMNVNSFTARSLPVLFKNEDGSAVRPTTATSNKSIYFTKESLTAYKTELIVPNGTLFAPRNPNEPVQSEKLIFRRICQNSLCCDFVLNITTSYSRSRPNISRGDDYSHLYYRLAVFDGLRNYDGADKGCVQTCAIVSCVNTSLSSCGLRSDSHFAVPASISNNYYQTDLVFQSIKITGNITNNNSLVGPNVLLSGQAKDSSYGALLSPSSFVFINAQVNGSTTFQTLKPTKIVTASVYGRLFNKDWCSVSSGVLSGKAEGFGMLYFILPTLVILLKH